MKYKRIIDVDKQINLDVNQHNKINYALSKRVKRFR